MLTVLAFCQNEDTSCKAFYRAEENLMYENSLEIISHHRAVQVQRAELCLLWIMSSQSFTLTYRPDLE